jgi:hypothetical protein
MEREVMDSMKLIIKCLMCDDNCSYTQITKCMSVLEEELIRTSRSNHKNICKCKPKHDALLANEDA